jgi:PA14 domain/FlgD Ig-like domain/Secretion system C-terminal sorting domain
MLTVKSLRTVLFIALTLLLPGFLTAQTAVPFSFSMPASASTSAGVFNNNGTLLKTLWSGVTYSAGSHAVTWDGTLDDGTLAPPGSYDIRVLSNNVQYHWDGVVGNTSDAVSGSTVQHFFEHICGMAISGTSAYFATGYNEGTPSQAKFLTSNPQVRMDVFNSFGSGTGQSTSFMTTDGTTVYYGGSDPFSNNTKWFVYGTKTAGDNEATFPSGTNYTCVYGPTYHSAVDFIDDANANVSGMAVQKTGNYLFVSHKKLNEIHVLDKTTGALVRKIAFTAPCGLTTDNNNNLWAIYTLNGTTVLNKFTVQSDGSLSAPLLTLGGLLDPLAMAVSPDGNTIVVADGGNSQQLKAYDDASGTFSWVFGQAGGYLNNPNVANDKFYFSDLSGGVHESFIAFQPDGSFWVGDVGNYRSLHFSASRTYLDRLMFLPNNYSVAVDPNNPSRVFAEYLEFNIDYSKPLSPNNGSWTLAKNWRAMVPASYYSGFMTNILKFVTTLNNGRTYALLQNLSTTNYEIVELPPSGPIRFTGILPNGAVQILPDGSLAKYAIAGLNQLAYWQKFPLQGFNGSNNPIWAMGAGDTLATVPRVGGTDPVDWGTYPMAGGLTSSGIVVSFDKDVAMFGHGSGYHLGGMRAGDNKFLWKTAKSTSTGYAGAFPTDGGFDIGNNVQYPGGVALALDRNIFWNYHGEFWKNSQVNKWNQVYDDGLFIGQFGVTGPEVQGQIAAPMMAGNVFSANVVNGPDGNVYLYHNDESHHGGAHRWKISGLNTIAEQTVVVVIPPYQTGLLGTYFDDNQLNNFDIKKRRIDATVDNNTVPAEIQNTNAYSVRWTGYVIPAYTENYTFYINTDKSIRLWVNNQLVINNWTNGTQNESQGTITLTAGTKYSIRIDKNGSNASLSWSSQSQPKQIIPAVSLVPANPPDYSTGVDLMEGLLFDDVLQNNLFGWSRNPANEDYTGPAYWQWWSAKTGIKAYDKTKSADVAVAYTQNNGTYTINRDLGNNQVVTAWNLSGNMDYEGNNGNSAAGQGGFYLEVLDAAGKIITRFYTTLDWKNNLPYVSITANKTVMVDDKAELVQPIVGSAQPISITVTSGFAIFKYGNYAPVTTALFDASSNWQTPKTMRLYFWTSGSNYSRSVDLLNMRFSNNQLFLLPLKFVSVSAQATGKDAKVSWVTENEVNVSSFQVERSTDGVSFLSIGTVASKNQEGQQTYNYTDGSVPGGTVYYRIRSTDKDGKTSYSTVTSVSLNDGKFSFYPNPVKNTLSVNHPAAGEAGKLEILSADGKKLKTADLTRGSTSTYMNTQSLTAGFYFLRFSNGSTILTTPFIKQ